MRVKVANGVTEAGGASVWVSGSECRNPVDARKQIYHGFLFTVVWLSKCFVESDVRKHLIDVVPFNVRVLGQLVFLFSKLLLALLQHGFLGSVVQW